MPHRHLYDLSRTPMRYRCTHEQLVSLLFQIRNCFGCYDEISTTKERHCNWVRFLRTSTTYSEDVNVIGTRVKGEPLFEVVKNIPANTELVVFFLPERQEEVFFMPAVNYLRNSLYRRTMDTILEGTWLQSLMSIFEKLAHLRMSQMRSIHSYQNFYY